jgi:hypothetical protein
VEFPNYEQLTLWQGASRDDLASLTVLPGSEKARTMTVRSGEKCLGSSKKSDPVGLLAKMLLTSSIWGSTTHYLTWRASVTQGNRLLYRLTPSVANIEGIDCSLLPTPTASMAKGTSRSRYKGSVHYKASHTTEALRSGPNDATLINPNYAEVIMSFPEGWTETE